MTVWPAVAEPVLAREADTLARWHSSTSVTALGCWEPVFDPDAPATGVCRDLLLLGLCSCSPTVQRWCVDGLAACLSDARAGSGQLAESLSRLLVLSGDGALPVARWAKGLDEVAQISIAKTVLLRGALERMLTSLPRPARVPLALLELLYEWSLEAGKAIRDPEARAALESVPGGGKTSRLVRRLLALEGRSSTRESEARTLILEARVQRARRSDRLRPDKQLNP